MAYADIADMTDDFELFRRLTACAVGEGKTQTWVYESKYLICTSPGWDSAYAYARDTGNPNPGRDGAVITDAMILSAIQAIIAKSP